MNKTVEILFDHALKRPGSKNAFDTPEVNELYSLLQLGNNSKEQFDELLNRFQRATQKAAFEQGFYTAVDLLTKEGGTHEH